MSHIFVCVWNMMHKKFMKQSNANYVVGTFYFLFSSFAQLVTKFGHINIEHNSHLCEDFFTFCLFETNLAKS